MVHPESARTEQPMETLLHRGTGSAVMPSKTRAAGGITWASSASYRMWMAKYSRRDYGSSSPRYART